MTVRQLIGELNTYAQDMDICVAVNDKVIDVWAIEPAFNQDKGEYVCLVSCRDNDCPTAV